MIMIMIMIIRAHSGRHAQGLRVFRATLSASHMSCDVIHSWAYTGLHGLSWDVKG